MIKEALEYLNELVRSGVEFPEAEYRTLYEFPSVSREQLLDVYDAQELAK